VQAATTIRPSNLLFPTPQYPVARVRHVLPFVRGRVTTIGGVVAGIGDPLTFERDEIPPLLRPRPLFQTASAHRAQRVVAFHPGLVTLPAGGHPVEGFQRLGPVQFGPPLRRLGQPDPIERERHLRHLRPRRYTPS